MTRFLTAPVLYGLLGICLILGAATVVQTLRLSSEQAAHSATRAKHAEQTAKVAAIAVAAAEKAAEARTAFHEHNSAAKLRRDQEVSDAYNRGRAAAAGIAAGTVVVREVWRDRECPQAAPGPGAQPAGRLTAIDPGRATAIGEVLGLGGEFDADYSLAYERLTAAQGLLNACYEQSAGISHE